MKAASSKKMSKVRGMEIEPDLTGSRVRIVKDNVVGTVQETVPGTESEPRTLCIVKHDVITTGRLWWRDELELLVE
jgi:hypothetical protein